MEFRDALISLDVNLPETLHRFSGNEGLLRRFVMRFPQDATYRELKDAIEQGDSQKIERTAHTLKGLSANLGFGKLQAACNDLVIAVRQGQGSSVPALYETVRAEYDKILQYLGQVDA